MAERVRTFDWSRTAIGPADRWPQSLKTAVRILLESRFPMFLWWGPHLINIYNDGYVPILGARHPEALGRSAPQIWNEIWPVVGPQADIVMREARATWNESVLLVMERFGFTEETYFTFSYSPAPDDAGGVGGVFCACTEDTGRVLGERRLRTLRDLGERTLMQAKDAEQACRAAATTLGENGYDFPFALLYLIDPGSRTARLVESVGVDALDDGAWQFEKVIETGEGLVVDDLERRFGQLPAGPWTDDWTRRAFVQPLARSGTRELPAGFLVSGLSPRLAFDDDYRSYLELAGGQIATAIANARAFQEERHRAQALADLDRAKTTFFSNVSHEFRTPLTLMLGPLEEVLASRERLVRQDREQLDVAHRNALRLLKLVNTLLDFSRIEAARMQGQYSPVDLAALTSDLASVFRSAIEMAGLQLVVDCPPLPEPVYVDREMWEKIVLNLISNAFKFTFEGKIEIVLRRAGQAAELMVRDTGTGIPADELPRIFERFHRVRDARGRTYEGTGIGLALVEELVHLHGGTVRVESEVDRGSTFTISVPFGTAHLPADRIGAAEVSDRSVRADAYVAEAMRWLPGREAVPTVDAAARGTGERILLADDNRDMREYVCKLLEQSGYDVEEVIDGEAALAAVRRHLPDLVLADVMMPRLDGLALLKTLRADDRTSALPVILLSARVGEEARLEGMQAGADSYLEKPFHAKELLTEVATRLEIARTRRLADAALLESERKYRSLFESIDAGFCICEAIVDEHGRPRDYRFLEVNAVFAEQTGLHGATGKTALELVPTLEHHWIEVYCNVALTRESTRFEQGSRAMGRWFDVYAFPFGDPASRRFAILFDDITTRKRMEDALRESEERFREMADNAPVMTWVTDSSGLSTFLSKPWYEFTGQTPATALGLGWLDAIHPDDRERTTDIFQSAKERHAPFQLEYRIRRADGEYRWAIDSAAPRIGAGGTFIGYVGSVIDITDRKHAEDAIRESAQALRDADRMKDEFLATLSHELRTPLTSILGWAQMIQGRRAGDDEVRSGIDAIARSAKVQSALIEDVLDISRITTGKMRLDRRPSEIAAVIRAAIETVQPAAEAKQVDLRSSLSGDLGTILVDPDRLQQIIWNLLSNAIKFTPPGGRVEIKGSRADREVKIEVRDTGSGIPAAFLPHIFERFRQADSSSRRAYSGLGLGLALSKSLTELHGGRIEVQSEEGKGSHFTVTIPAFDGAPSKSQRQEAAPASLLSGSRVLLVDNDDDARAVFSALLRQSGAQVRVASSADAALGVLDQFDPHVVITDVAMPDRDGYDLLREIRSRHRYERLPVVALTAQDPEGGHRPAGPAFTRHLAKPIDLDAFVRAVREVVGA